MPKFTLKDAMRQIFAEPRDGFYTREGLKDIVLDSGLGRWQRDSIIPTDYCYNRTNNGIGFESQPHCFIVDKHANYRILGLNAGYTGKIYHRTRNSSKLTLVGEWRKTNDGKTKPFFDLNRD